MPDARVCGQCGAEVSGYSAEGLCPKCMLLGGLGVPAAEQFAATLIGSAPELLQSKTRSLSSSFGRLRYFGDYELLEEIARGGMGVVYKARQMSLNRIVAVKMIVAGQLATAEAMKRFLGEAESAANLHHPNIVGIYEVGEHDGQHYFSMEYIDGENLAALVRETPLPASRAARYVRLVAEAIEYAHERGTLHRDLKPSNVLLDASDQPRITDFGLAKQVKADSDLTLSGQVLGTPSFMPPEQAAGERYRVGPWSDVYSLGAILYHLVTGRPPFVAETVLDTLRLVTEADPVSVRLLNPGVPRDLETICLKCLEKNPTNRYATAQALADELGRFLRDEPIQARPAGTPEKIWRWCKRKPALAGTAAVAGLAVAFGLAGVLWQWRRVERGAEVLRHNVYAADMKLAQVSLEEHDLGRTVTLLRKHIPRPGGEDLRGFEWRYLWNRCQGDELFTFRGHDDPILYTGFSPDGRFLAAASIDGTIRIWEASSKLLLYTLTVSTGGNGAGLAFSPAGKLFAASNGGKVIVWNTEHWQKIAELEAEGTSTTTRSLVFSRDGSLLAASNEHGISMRDTTTWRELMRLDELGGYLLLVFSADGKTLYASKGDHVDVWNLETRTRTRELKTESARSLECLALSPDGERLAGGDDANMLHLWELRDHRHTAITNAHSSWVLGIAFSPDGKLLASGGLDSLIRLWDVTTLKPQTTLKGHLDEVWAVAFAPSGDILTSGSKDGTVKLWSIVPKWENRWLTNIYRPLWSSPNGQTLLTLDFGGTLTSWNVSVGSIAAKGSSSKHHNTENAQLSRAVSADGRYMALVLDDSMLEVWDVEEDQKVASFRVGTNEAASVAFHPNGRLLAVCGSDASGVAKIWDWAAGEVQAICHGCTFPLTFSPDGSKLAAVGPEKGYRTLTIWDWRRHQEIVRLRGQRGPILRTAFTPDGKYLAAASDDSTVFLWETASWQKFAELRGHREGVTCLAFSPDSRTLATGSTDDTVKLWHVATGQELITIRDFAEDVGALMFTSDAGALAVGCFGKRGARSSMQLWRAPSLKDIDAAAERSD